MPPARVAARAPGKQADRRFRRDGRGDPISFHLQLIHSRLGRVGCTDLFFHTARIVVNGHLIAGNDAPVRRSEFDSSPLLASGRGHLAGSIAIIGLLNLMVLMPFGASAQEVDSLLFEGAEAALRPPRVFLDCRPCDQTFLRREIPFVDYVRDRQDADIHLLVTRQQTGGGGSEYVLNFIGQKRHLGADQRLVYTSPKGETSDEERGGLARKMKLGLVPYVAQTPYASQLTVSFTEPEEPLVQTAEADPWRSWVFEIESEASLSGEASQRSLFLSASAAADRVTESWKIQMRIYADHQRRRFERDDSEVIQSRLTSRDVVTSIVYSLAEHWSAGLFGRANSSTFLNIDLGLRFAPALEYSVFPYEQSSRRELTFAYRIGSQSMNYVEETIFSKMSEVLSNESLTGRLRIVQPWGSIFLYLEGSHYLHDFSKNRLELFSNVALRVFRGLSLRVSGGLEIIHDQLYLPKGEGTLEDLLLQQKQLATTYEYRLSLGVSYTFGSIYSNVVNTRL